MPTITIFFSLQVNFIDLREHQLPPLFLPPLINMDFVFILDYKIPAFLADIGTPLFTNPSSLSSSRTLHAPFIGTNDLGNTTILTDCQLPDLF